MANPSSTNKKQPLNTKKSNEPIINQADVIPDSIAEVCANVEKSVKKEKAPVAKKEKKTTDKPKRQPTAYNIFIGKKLSELRKDKPGLASTEYMKMASVFWKEMSDEDKKNLLTSK
jgi:hypothetical protein